MSRDFGRATDVLRQSFEEDGSEVGAVVSKVGSERWLGRTDVELSSR